jgi:molecular chaperone DnaK
MGYQLGVDLGTTYTSAAVVEDGEPKMFSLGDHEFFVPSVLVLDRHSEVIVGEPAERRATTAPESTAREFKRRLGDATPVILDGVPYSPHALTATLLRWVFDAVSARQGGPPDAMAVTYPANWGSHRKEVFGQAVQQIGVAATVFVTEPEAAAIRYAALSRIQPGQAIGVYDLGGGTFDAAVVQREGDAFQLIGRPAGIEQLGGVDFDEAVFDHVRRAIGERALEIDLSEPAVVAALHQLRRDCVQAKEALSHDVETLIPVNLPGTNTVIRLTRSEFEDTIRPLLLETVSAFRRSLESAGCAPQELAAVLLAGGSSRIPLVAELLTADLGRPVAVNADPKQIVAMGAAMRVAVARPPVTERTKKHRTKRRPPPAKSFRADRILQGATLAFGITTLALSGYGFGSPGPGLAVVANDPPLDGVHLGEAVSVSVNGVPVADGQFMPSVAGFDLQAQAIGTDGGFQAAGLRNVLVGPFKGIVKPVVSVGNPDLVAVVRPSGGLSVGGVLSVPGVVGVILILFAFAYAESFLRRIRRGPGRGSGVLVGMGLVGAVTGLGTGVVGWTLGVHLLSGALLLLCALSGLATGLALTMAALHAAAAPAAESRPRP